MMRCALRQMSRGGVQRLRVQQPSRAYAIDLSKPKHQEIDKNVKKSPLVLFMKGTPEQPQCGFSGGMVQILNAEGVKFDSYNVLADEELRSEIKEYSDWPTIPQLYIDGEFAGGFDIVKAMFMDGTLRNTLKEKKLSPE